MPLIAKPGAAHRAGAAWLCGVALPGNDARTILECAGWPVFADGCESDHRVGAFGDGLGSAVVREVRRGVAGGYGVHARMSWLVANDPIWLLTLTMTGDSDRRSSGKNALVTRTMPTTRFQ